MAIQWKRNSRYPSVTRPGVFPRIQQLDDQGVDVLAETWENLTGIDEEEINKFKFSLGTWVQFSRRNREIIVLSSEAANKITFAITSDLEEGQTEPKPNYLPEGYVHDLIYKFALFQDYGAGSMLNNPYGETLEGSGEALDISVAHSPYWNFEDAWEHMADAAGAGTTVKNEDDEPYIRQMLHQAQCHQAKS